MSRFALTARQGRGLAIACCLLAAGCAQSPGGAPVLPSPAASGPASASAPANVSAAEVMTRLATFEPVGASFITPDTGWVLGRPRGCLSCAMLVHTADGGRRWHVLPSPPAPTGIDVSPATGVSNIAFADAANGFLYGPDLLASHDGGRSWTRQPLPPVQDLGIGGGRAYVLTQDASTWGLRRTVIGSTQWARLPLPAGAVLPAGSSNMLRLYIEGTTLVLLRTGSAGVDVSAGQIGRLWISTAAGTAWQPRNVPCRAPAGGGAQVLSIAPGHPDAWLLDCFNNDQSSQEQNTRHILYGTIDGGLSWVRMPNPTSHNLPELLADNGADHAFLATAGTDDFLAGTFDGGLHWRLLIRSGGSFHGWADLRFLDARTGFVVAPVTYPPEHLYRTDDGGRTWRILQF
jgi:photosystem II stability/assembly factor-like uncharacterized protein